MSKIYIVGIGPGDFEGITLKAVKVLNSSDVIMGKMQFDSFVGSFFPKIKFAGGDLGTKERCRLALRMAANGHVVSLIGQGDTGIYGMAGIVLGLIEEENINIDVDIVPGVTAAVAGAALLGAPLMQDFAIITLSDNLAESDKLVKKIEYAVKADFGLVFYSPCNPTRSNLLMAYDVLLTLKPGHTPIGLAKNISRINQEVLISTLQELSLETIDKFTVVYIGNSKSYIRHGKIITPL